MLLNTLYIDDYFQPAPGGCLSRILEGRVDDQPLKRYIYTTYNGD